MYLNSLSCPPKLAIRRNNVAGVLHYCPQRQINVALDLILNPCSTTLVGIRTADVHWASSFGCSKMIDMPQ